MRRMAAAQNANQNEKRPNQRARSSGEKEEKAEEEEGKEKSDGWRLTLGVSSHAESVDEPGGESDDVLQGSGERDSRDVLDAVDPEHRGVEDGVPGRGVCGRGRPDGGLAELGVSDLEGDVGSSYANEAKRMEEGRCELGR